MLNVKYIKNIITAIALSVFIAAPVLGVALSSSTYAATNDKTCEQSILGIPTWFRGLAVRDSGGSCSIVSPGTDLNGKKLDLSGFIWRIALNIVDIGLSVVGIIAFFFILYGGFQFLTGGSNPSQIEKARKTILNAVVGLIISLGAVAIINLVFGILG
jgi:hypothetical protein